jgi:hypothetical protein
MFKDESQDVLLGSPAGGIRVDTDAYATKAGGAAVWFKGHSHERPVCKNCKTPLFLVAQVRRHCPTPRHPAAQS